MLKRTLQLKDICATKSAFLFGPRQTGKSTLIREQLKNATVIDLLKSENFVALQRKPELLRSKIPPSEKLVVIDEVQRIPELLNEVHYLIEEKKLLFLLAGSSARKLRGRGVNLLAGRARNHYLFPLTSYEMGEFFSLKNVLSSGSLPPLLESDNPRADLSAYVENYLQFEIAAEALTRNIPAFSRFLEIAALTNTQIINYTKIANDAQIAPSTAQEYFQILRDTLMGFDLPSWKEGKKRKVSKTSKFYFFDIGVVNAILGRWSISPSSTEYGDNLEAFLFGELQAYTYYNQRAPVCYWRTQSKDEVDFIFNQEIAIEVKSTTRVSNKDTKGLVKLKEEEALKRYLLLAHVPTREYHDGIEVWPVEEFLGALWSGEFG